MRLSHARELSWFWAVGDLGTLEEELEKVHDAIGRKAYDHWKCEHYINGGDGGDIAEAVCATLLAAGYSVEIAPQNSIFQGVDDAAPKNHRYYRLRISW